MIRFAAAVIVAACSLAGCASETKKQAAELQPIAVEFGQATRPIAFRRIVVRIPRNQVIGTLGEGYSCAKIDDLRPRGSRIVLDDEMLTDVFADELKANGYRVVGDPNALFEDPSLAEAEYLIGALITDIEMNVCLARENSFGILETEETASVYLKTNWQVYSTLQRRVVFETDTDGSHAFDDGGDTDAALADAFGHAARNLLANTEFYQLVAGDGRANSGSADREPIALGGLRYGITEAFVAPAARASVVTVRVGGGHGSGFFITSDGYILTNQHVVSGAKNVNIMLHTGRDVIGEVVRVDNARDVALIKVADEGFVPVSVARREPDIGADIYAVGAPLDEDLSGTVSKGIVSAYRVMEGQRYLQGDVNIQPGSSGGPLFDASGNVVGLTVSAISKMGVSTGLNFFIPITSAFEALQISAPAS